jgi:hypothetical protein
MSGGHFDYKQWYINQIADDVEKIIERNGRKKTDEELKDESWRRDDWYEKYPEDLYHYKYPDEVIEKFKEGLTILRQAAVYAQRIDWLLSGDDGEETFLKRLEKELSELKEDNNE